MALARHGVVARIALPGTTPLRPGPISYHRPMSSEARVHPRLRLNAMADVIGREVVLARQLGDISLGGCRFDGPAWEQQGQEVQIVLSFPRVGVNLPLSGIVVRASDEDMGVRFDNLSDEQKWALRKHIREIHGSSN
jgi:hypothetical protein